MFVVVANFFLFPLTKLPSTFDSQMIKIYRTYTRTVKPKINTVINLDTFCTSMSHDTFIVVIIGNLLDILSSLGTYVLEGA